MKGQRTIGARVFLGLGTCLALLVVVGITSVASMMSMKQTVSNLATREAPMTALSNKIVGEVRATDDSLKQILLGALTSNRQKAAQGEQQLGESRRATLEDLRQIEPLLSTEEGKRNFAEMETGIKELEQSVPSFVAAIKEQRFDEATRLQNEKFDPLLKRIHEASDRLAAQQQGLIETQSANANTKAVSSIWMIVLLTAASLAVAGLLFWGLRGNLAVLRNIAGEIAAGATQVGSASAQVSSSSQALAQGSSEQAASLEETSASTEEINSMTQKNAENARAAASETENADHLLTETDQKLKQLIESMNQINTSSEKIGKIIRVIDEIAFQTNILALNAAVEAARAGEAGMGFAVVADEVRNLAQRCAQAAKDTSELIEESITRSAEGKSRLDEVADWVSRVVDNSSRIRVLANEVNLGSQEQARGIDQIAKAVGQMQQVTQSVAASAEQGASAGEEMSAQAMTLNDAVGRLKDLVGGGDPEAADFAAVAAPAKAAKPAAVPARMVAAGKAKQAAPRFSANAKNTIPMDGDFRDF